jgi:hypothetical protein
LCFRLTVLVNVIKQQGLWYVYILSVTYFRDMSDAARSGNSTDVCAMPIKKARKSTGGIAPAQVKAARRAARRAAQRATEGEHAPVPPTDDADSATRSRVFWSPASNNWHYVTSGAVCHRVRFVDCGAPLHKRRLLPLVIQLSPEPAYVAETDSVSDGCVEVIRDAANT